MKVVSANVGLPIEIEIDGKPVMTGIFKRPLSGSIRVQRLNLVGDRQADLNVHGGPDKAVYVYPSEHYPFWQEYLGEPLSWGALGENLTVEGLDEDNTRIGDQFQIGTAVFEVSQPRLPCFKLAAKLRRPEIIKDLLESRRTGFYLRVIQEGALQAGDEIRRVPPKYESITIHQITDLYVNKHAPVSELDRVLSLKALASSWRKHFSAIRETRVR